MNTRTLLYAALLGLAATPMLATAEDADESFMSQAGDNVSDAALTTRIKAAFATETQLNTLDISVETTDGVVTLSGEVDTPAQVSLAEEIVNDIDGVESVHNKLEADDS